jgi:hypothetical protein
MTFVMLSTRGLEVVNIYHSRFVSSVTDRVNASYPLDGSVVISGKFVEALATYRNFSNLPE